MIGSLNPKTLRTMAKAMLDLADAVDDKSVRIVSPGRSYVEHAFMRPTDFTQVISEEAPIDMSEVIKMVRCKHDLTYYVFHLVGAQCSVNKTFFIDSERTRVLAESSHYLTRKQ